MGRRAVPLKVRGQAKGLPEWAEQEAPEDTERVGLLGKDRDCSVPWVTAPIVSQMPPEGQEPRGQSQVEAFPQGAQRSVPSSPLTSCAMLGEALASVASLPNRSSGFLFV